MIRFLPLTLKAYPFNALFVINSKSLRAFPWIFGNIPLNVWQHSSECGTQPFGTQPFNIQPFPWNVWWDSPGCFPQNIWHHSLECLATFPGIFGETLRNLWRLSPEYNATPIPRPSHNGPLIPFPVPLFLILCIAYLV